MGEKTKCIVGDKVFGQLHLKMMSWNRILATEWHDRKQSYNFLKTSVCVYAICMHIIYKCICVGVCLYVQSCDATEQDSLWGCVRLRTIGSPYKALERMLSTSCRLPSNSMERRPAWSEPSLWETSSARTAHAARCVGVQIGRCGWGWEEGEKKEEDRLHTTSFLK